MPSSGSRPAWLGLLLSAAGGVLLSLAFPPLGWWLFAPVAIALITLGWQAGGLRTALLGGLLAGFGFFATTLSWLAVVGSDAWLALSGYCALWFVPLGVGTWVVRRLPGWPLYVAAMWMLDELGRGSVPLGGFAWGRLAFSQADAPTAGLAAIGGMPLIGFVLALAGALLAHWIRAPRKLATAWEPALIMAIICGGALVPRPAFGQSDAGPARVTAALVQGSVPQSGLDAMSERRVVLDNHVVATKRLADDVTAGRVPRPQFVIWPENSSDLDPSTSTEAARAIEAAADAIGVPILVGAVVIIPGDPLQLGNAGIVWNPQTGPGERYLKRHLVPFGEFVPLRPILTRLIGRYERVPYDFAPGSDSGVLQVGPARLADVICFEVADDRIVRQEVRDGGRALAVQTNNATYAATSQPEQQLAMSRLRAVEHGRTVLVAATSGITVVIAPDGAVIEQAALNASQSLVHSVALRDSLSVADRIGMLPDLLFGAITVAGCFLALRRGRRNDRQPEAPIPPSAGPDD